MPTEQQYISKLINRIRTSGIKGIFGAILSKMPESCPYSKFRPIWQLRICFMQHKLLKVGSKGWKIPINIFLKSLRCSLDVFTIFPTNY